MKDKNNSSHFSVTQHKRDQSESADFSMCSSTQRFTHSVLWGATVKKVGTNTVKADLILTLSAKDALACCHF